ncbi:MAG TPA: penicillin-binding protein 2 [Steroidobacteraceae bacterium]|nr:penicillin-binding protein 2 [Steroidobacteraceae bacterium]
MARHSRLKDHNAEQRLFGRRVVAASLVIFMLLGVLFARLFWLQIVRYEYFTALSQGNRIRIDPIPPPRGLILDRHGEPLALNRPAFQLELTREQTPDLDDTLARLVALQLIDPEDLGRVKRTIMARRAFDAVPVRLQLSEEELARFAVHRPDFPGVEIRPRLTRHYPHGGVGVHAVGYVGAISEKDQERIDEAAYAGTTLIGKLGVERTYEEVLHGDTGYQQLLVNAQGRRVDRVGISAPELERKEPIAGDDLILSIDAQLQEVVEAALGDYRAAVVAIDPANGDVLAFVSTPTFDPNGFARGLTVAEYRALEDDLDRPLYDRALRGVYPPGSTIKPLVALAALQYGVTEPGNTRFCKGVWQFPNSSHRYRDWKKGGHGTVDMTRAIAQSCDTYFYAISDQIGIDRMHDFLVQFGLGDKTGIDILGERDGLVPSRAWKKKAFKSKSLQVWFPGETVIAGIGQGYMLATPLQLAHVAATVGMRGKRFAPRLVKGVRNSVTGEVRELPPRTLPDVEVREPRDWDVIINGMVGVMSPGGTAYRSQVGAPFQIAGKTGTAQVFTVGQNEKYNESQISERLRDHALFIAFAPADAPKLAVAVLVENGRSGSGTAAPIARKVFDAYLNPQSVTAGAAAPEAATPPPAGGEE